ncbi:MAG: efflux RND transporter periplasmic adaptor subunit [Bryobacteraceae bacterium]|jgi:RND family efflux transporter MFP subunit
MKNNKGIFAFTAAVALLIGLIVYRGIGSRVDAEAALTTQTDAAAIPSVAVVHPTLGSPSQEIVLPGNAQAFTDTPIYARTNGYLKAWHVDIGARVQQGQLLAEIETPELDQQLQQAEADLNSARATLEIADITNNRWQKLVAKRAVSMQEADQAKSDFVGKQAMVAANEANVRRLKQLQDFEKVTAPFDGVITARNTDIGALINAGASKELFHLASIQQLRVYTSVPEVDAAAVQNGARVTLTQDAYPGQIFTGTIVRNSNAIDQTTRTLNVEVDVDNSTGRLLPGAYLFVHFRTPGASHSVTIPSNTLLFRSEGLRVGVVRNGRIQLMPVSIGHDFGNAVEILSGLTVKDSIVVDPSDSLTNGTLVHTL